MRRQLRYRLGGAINTLADENPAGIGQAGNVPVVDPVATPLEATWVHQQRLYFTPEPPDLTEKPRMISVWYIPLPPRFIRPEAEVQQIVPGFAHWDEYMVADLSLIHI